MRNKVYDRGECVIDEMLNLIVLKNKVRNRLERSFVGYLA